MKKYLCMCISCAFVFFAKAQEERLRDYVNPFVGTDGMEIFIPVHKFHLEVYRSVRIQTIIFMMLHPVINIPILPLWDSVCHI